MENLGSVGTRALATPLLLLSMTYRQQVREVIWSGGGELEKVRYGVPELTRVSVGYRRFLCAMPSTSRSTVDTTERKLSTECVSNVFPRNSSVRCLLLLHRQTGSQRPEIWRNAIAS